MPAATSRRVAARWIGWSPVRVWGLGPTERLTRSLVRAGVWDCAAWTGTAPADRDLLLFLGDHVYDDALVAALAKARSGTVLLRADGRPAAIHVAPGRADEAVRLLADGHPPPDDLVAISPAELVPPHQVKLRKRETPVVVPVTEHDRHAVEDLLFGASYKGVTDAVTKYLWPAPARAVTRWCASLQISPNAVTLVSLALAVLAFLLFREGILGLGLLAAWGMTFLDTVDGKLARVTLTSSRLGDVLDHGLDLVHPPFWWWAWWAGTGAADADALVVVLAGYVLLRVQEGLFLRHFGIELHVWRRFDSRFRLVTARRNPILVLLTLGWLAGAPAMGFHLAAVWTMVSLAVHAVRILMAARAQQAGERMASWLDG
jgi:phosphatidylglycerophosphate synthase